MVKIDSKVICKNAFGCAHKKNCNFSFITIGVENPEYPCKKVEKNVRIIPVYILPAVRKQFPLYAVVFNREPELGLCYVQNIDYLNGWVSVSNGIVSTNIPMQHVWFGGREIYHEKNIDENIEDLSGYIKPRKNNDE